MNSKLKTKIMRLIIDRLTSEKDVQYIFNGYSQIYNDYIVSMDFILDSGQVKDNFNVWGNLECTPVILKAQYDNTCVLQDYPVICERVSLDLQTIADEIDQILVRSKEC